MHAAGVAYAEIDQVATPALEPNDALFRQEQYSMTKIQAPNAWAYLNKAAASAPVCVLDTTYW
jgi:hypothetical protein